MSIIAINNQAELICYKAELTAVKAELNLYDLNTDEVFFAGHPAAVGSAGDYSSQLNAAHDLLVGMVTTFTSNTERLKKQPIEETIDHYLVTPTMRLAWTVMLGVGLIIQETVLLAATLVKSVLFPVHFAVDGVRSLWDLRRIWNDKNSANRHLHLSATGFNILGLAIAATLVGLAVSNPFALPVVFFGIVGAGLAKNSYLYRQNKAAIKALKVEEQVVNEEIGELNGKNNNTINAARRTTLTAKKKRIGRQLTTLHEQRMELRRTLFLMC